MRFLFVLVIAALALPGSPAAFASMGRNVPMCTPQRPFKSKQSHARPDGLKSTARRKRRDGSNYLALGSVRCSDGVWALSAAARGGCAAHGGRRRDRLAASSCSVIGSVGKDRPRSPLASRANPAGSRAAKPPFNDWSARNGAAQASHAAGRREKAGRRLM